MPSRLWITINARLRPLDRGGRYEDPLAQRCRVVPLPSRD